MEERPRKRKFNIGDLVTVVSLIELAFEDQTVDRGDIGLVLEHSEEDDLFGYDYLVLFRGLELVFFQDELEEYCIEEF